MSQNWSTIISTSDCNDCNDSVWLFSTSVPLSMFVCSILILKSSFGLNRAARTVGGISLFWGLKSLHREPGAQSEHISTKKCEDVIP